MKNNKWIFFDWGRTLHDPDTKHLFPETLDIISHCKSKNYKLGIISLAKHQSGQTKEERTQTIQSFNLKPYFDFIEVTDQSKEDLYKELIAKFKIKAKDLTVVDDRTIRGIAWGNKFGAKTIWLKRGKFSEELPNEGTGNPTHTIKNLLELREVL